MKTKFLSNGLEFSIEDSAKEAYPELVDLILKTESMDQVERQYWFDVLPSMTDEQIDRIYDILATEKRKLEELELRYWEEMKGLNEKHMIEWQKLKKN